MVRSLSERLGLSSGTRAVILHADDVGMSHAHNVGFAEVIETGIVTSGSVMVPGPWFPEAAAYARAHPALDLGVHLCLNSEFTTYRWGPVVSADRVPSLVDGDGYFWPSTSETLDHVDPRDVQVELRAQIERALRSGIDVTHLDAHMGTVMMEGLLPIYVDLGRQYRLPLFFPRPTAEMLEEIGHPEVIPELEQLLESLDSRHLFTVDHVELRSLSFDPADADTHYRKVISELEPGVTHFLIHPARMSEELEAITPDSCRQRDAERRIFSSAQTHRWLEEQGVERIGYRRVRDALRAS